MATLAPQIRAAYSPPDHDDRPINPHARLEDPMAKSKLFPELNLTLPELDWKEIFGPSKVPNLEPGKIIDAHRKNLEAWGQAQKILTEGMQSITHRQGELIRDSLNEAGNLMRTLTEQGGIDPLKQAEHVKAVLEAQIAHLRELAEMVGKLQTEAFSVLRERLIEGIEEVRAVAPAAKAAAEAPAEAAPTPPAPKPPAAKPAAAKSAASKSAPRRTAAPKPKS